MSRKQFRLDVPEEAYRHLLFEKRMLDFIAPALLVGDENSLSAIIAEKRCPVVEAPEVLRRKLAAIDQREDEAISERPKLFDEIERQARPAGPIDMKVAPTEIANALRLRP